jgi:hypothetical protein
LSTVGTLSEDYATHVVFDILDGWYGDHKGTVLRYDLGADS